jgi:peptidoglycan/xylan/chitin deacetylase (PgdA/CDA1 family)
VTGACLLAACLGRPRPAPVPPLPAFRVEGVATWRGDATAAYSIVHDDVCDDHTLGVFRHADPQLTRRGLQAGFGVVGKLCEEERRWDDVARLRAHGHEVFSHSWSHPCMTADAKRAEACDPSSPRSTDFAQEIDHAAAVCAAHGIGRDFFIFPYDVCDPAAVARLRQLGYLGARCGAPEVNGPDFPDSFAIGYDVWGPAYSHHAGGPACQGVKPFETPPRETPAACRAQVLSALLDAAVAQRGWATREFHGFEGDAKAWEPIAPADYAAHLDDVAARVRAGALWVAGPIAVLKYRWARAQCPLPQVRGRALLFAAPSPECRRHATVLSYRLSVSAGGDPAALRVVQGQAVRPARKLGPGRFVVDADPTAGDAVIE